MNKQKEQFRPESTDLNMSLKEAYMEVNSLQQKLAVAMEQNLPRNINDINTFLIAIDNEKQINSKLEKEQQDFIEGYNEIQKLFNIIIRAKSSRIVAVHRVITNKGFRSKGINNGKNPTTNEDYIKLVEWLKETIKNPSRYKTTPLDRIYIPKKDNAIDNNPIPSKEKGDTYSTNNNLRPISIPSIKDRCLQSLYYICYSVYSEFVADPYSYAFRPGRCASWAAHNISLHLKNYFKAQWLV